MTDDSAPGSGGANWEDQQEAVDEELEAFDLHVSDSEADLDQ
ncbi:hypothetical protein [Nocardia sp. NPDC020380]